MIEMVKNSEANEIEERLHQVHLDLERQNKNRDKVMKRYQNWGKVAPYLTAAIAGVFSYFIFDASVLPVVLIAYAFAVGMIFAVIAVESNVGMKLSNKYIDTKTYMYALREQYIESVLGGKIVASRTGGYGEYWQWVDIEKPDGEIKRYNVSIFHSNKRDIVEVYE